MRRGGRNEKEAEERRKETEGADERTMVGKSCGGGCLIV